MAFLGTAHTVHRHTSRQNTYIHKIFRKKEYKVLIQYSQLLKTLWAKETKYNKIHMLWFHLHKMFRVSQTRVFIAVAKGINGTWRTAERIRTPSEILICLKTDCASSCPTLKTKILWTVYIPFKWPWNLKILPPLPPIFLPRNWL